ncbi:NlpC/P60 family protein [Micromonospora sp. WMMD1082]|uniref:NlpC/P60 family protein n=1 Tax=Micromonospora sp. WMMD1082 TaxID=3016104 RepID=UPI0024176430|nr:NlpC/P60 family protein [Micromonospora sp. WMMD1082]MDG4795415.1 NlpC/P60 family protein [Micromonospora sp. WMMD1082]
MTPRAATVLVTAVIGVALVCVGGLIGLTGSATACVPRIDPSTATAAAPPPALVNSYNAEQLTNATIIVSVGAGRGIPERGLIVAVAVALQESSLRNLGHLGAANDHDSLGLFQQRPSQGWGAPDQIMDPVYAANAFYSKLLTVTGWEQMPLTQAAQSVQRSAFPHAYAKWEPDATALVALSAGLYGGCTAGDGMSGGSEPLPDDFTLPPNTPLPVAIAIWWARQQLGTPYAFGGDCTDAHSGNPAHQCDCSSLIQQAYRYGGVSLPRVTDDQQHAGTPIASLTQARPGDMIFIPGSNGTMSDPGHVGLYIGHGLVIQAPHTGDVVKLTKVSAWANQIATIRRIVS